MVVFPSHLGMRLTTNGDIGHGAIILGFMNHDMVNLGSPQNLHVIFCRFYGYFPFIAKNT
jgi:hypothetical protein